MNLNLYDILKNILSENVSPSDVINAIQNKYQVIITYSDDKNRAPQKRLIEPYVYGTSQSGNSVFRAYQYNGDTYRGIPKWKLFRLDRVTSWQPTNNHFNAEPKERGWNAEDYNKNGDNSMTNVLCQVKLDYDDNSNNPYIKGSDLYKIRKQRDNFNSSEPVNINKNMNNNYGPSEINKNIKKIEDINSPEFKKMLDRNLKITQQEKNKKGFSLSNTLNNRGPINNNTNSDKNN